MADILFTYAPADAARAKAIAEALKAYGLDVAWDRTLLPGERYDAVINRRLAEAKAVVVLWSAASIGSSLIMDEAAAARDQGKLLPVRIDSVDSPLGFRQLQTADLAGWPNFPNSAHGIQSLAEALANAQGAQITTPPPSAWKTRGAPPHPQRAEDDASEGNPRFLRSGSFWGWTTLLAAIEGLLYFISPSGQAEMGVETAQRIGTMIGNVLGAFLLILLARALLHLSRKFVGKPTKGYFGWEMIVILVSAVLFTFATMADPTTSAQIEASPIGFIHQLNMMLLGCAIIVAAIFFIIRAILGLARRKT